MSAEESQAVVDEYARRLARTTAECVALTVALTKSQRENEALYRRLAGLPEEGSNGHE